VENRLALVHLEERVSHQIAAFVGDPFVCLEVGQGLGESMRQFEVRTALPAVAHPVAVEREPRSLVLELQSIEGIELRLLVKRGRRPVGRDGEMGGLAA
jgi:hypothetical protein